MARRSRRLRGHGRPQVVVGAGAGDQFLQVYNLI
jgi:hypothetical protein